MTRCEIAWNVHTPAEWEALFARARRSNLLQSPAYVRAVCPLQGQTARYGLIRIGGKEAGIVQIQEAGIMRNAIHAVILDRGPLWFDGFGNARDIDAFFAAFARQFPRRPGRMRRVIPEIPDAPPLSAIMRQHGYRRRPEPGYGTVWVDLRPDRETLHSSLSAPWRNKLRKAEKAGLTVERDETQKSFEWLLGRYISDKAGRGYDGPAPRTLRALAATFGGSGRMVTMRAFRDGEPVAGILLFLHGTGATWQTGWSSEQGKKTAAHNLLLWDAMTYLKDKGIHDFDLGGVNDATAQGIKIFKEGTGGEGVTLAGHYG